MTLASVLALGFLLGMRHATDADHLAAVATLATRSRSLGHTVLQGVAWGTGHTLTLMLFGGAVLVLGLVVPAQAAQALELAVGVMLVLLGAEALYRLRRERIHFHAHHHTGGVAHFHAHSHLGQDAPHDPARHEHPHGFPARALVVGMVHGMAGSAALVLLSLEALRSPAWGLAYIAVFGLGSILGMAALSAAIAVPLWLSSRRLTRARDGLSAAVGLATLILGCYIVFRIGAGDGLLG
ncbi:MAG TPA: urease accessory protein [Burkholderiales bacterium]|nr:urease accessory protein [Burkholderiales bacterium]